MEILKPGRPKGDTVAEWTCKSCNAEIRAKRSEGKLHMDQRDGDSIIFRCPCCQAENWVDLRKFK